MDSKLIFAIVQRRRLTAQHLQRTAVLPPMAVRPNSKTVRRDQDGEMPGGTGHRLAGRARVESEKIFENTMKHGYM